MPQAVKLRGHVTSICEGECASRDKTRDLIKTKKPCPKIGFSLRHREARWRGSMCGGIFRSRAAMLLPERPAVVVQKSCEWHRPREDGRSRPHDFTAERNRWTSAAENGNAEMVPGDVHASERGRIASWSLVQATFSASVRVPSSGRARSQPRTSALWSFRRSVPGNV